MAYDEELAERIREVVESDALPRAGERGLHPQSPYAARKSATTRLNSCGRSTLG